MAFWSHWERGSNTSSIRFELPELTKDGKSDPISHDNLLVYAFRINAISRSLNEAIKKSSLNLPPVKLDNSEFSYKHPNRSWIAISDDIMVIFLFSDVANTLNTNEILAVSVHEVCHVILGHKSYAISSQRDIKKEVDADRCTVESGVDKELLVSSLNKFASDGHEKLERIAALNSYQ